MLKVAVLIDSRHPAVDIQHIVPVAGKTAHGIFAETGKGGEKFPLSVPVLFAVHPYPFSIFKYPHILTRNLSARLTGSQA